MPGTRHLPLALGLSVLGCFPPDEGRSPPADQLYFPTAVAISPGATRLYVANSDYDLQFNAGTLMAFDLDALREQLPRYCESDAECPGSARCDLPTGSQPGSYWCVEAGETSPCGALGERGASDRLLAPGRCGAVVPGSAVGGATSVLVESVRVGAFVTDILYRQNPDPDGRVARLFMPVRGDATLHWVDVADDERASPGFELDCGQAEDGGCDEVHRRGRQSADENTRGQVLPPEPFGIAATEDGRALVTTHQVQGKVALFQNDWASGAAGGPRLQYVLDGLPSRVAGITDVPVPAYWRESGESYAPGFLVVFRNSPQVTLLRYFDDAAASPSRAFVDASRAVRIGALSQGHDSRGVVVDAEQRGECEAQCAAAPGDAASRLECLEGCLEVPLGVYVSNRSPAALLVGETRRSEGPAIGDDLPTFHDAVPLSFGPSRVVVGKVIGADGDLETRIFVVCFDTRKVHVYDPEARRVETVIETGRGPHGLAIDAQHGLAFLVHFTDSYIAVVDLDRRHSRTYGKTVALLGEPTAPRAAK